MVFYHKPCLLLLYVILFVISSWVFEWLLLLETGYTTYQLIEPLQNLSVTQLQSLLDGRGIQYSTLVEKWEIIDALQKSGNVQYMELLAAAKSFDENEPVEIIGKNEFYEQILEERESIWLIEIIPHDDEFTKERLIDDFSWKQLNARLKKIGINTAIIQCYKDPRLCVTQGWNYPQLLLSVPDKGYIFKKNLRMPTSLHLTVNAIMNWISNELNQLMEKSPTIDDINSVWLNSTSVKISQVPKMIYITELLNPPLLLVTLALRFSSRIRLSIFRVGASDKEQVIKSLKQYRLNGPPSLIVSTSENICSYGSKKGEILSTSALETYIKLRQPQTNDIFLVSLVIANFLAIVDLIDLQGTFWKHIIRTLFRFPVYNVFVFIIWLSLTSLFKFSWTIPFIDVCQQIIHKLHISHLLEITLYSILMVDNFFGLAIIALFQFGFILYTYKRIYGGSRFQDNQENEDDNWYTVFPMDSYIVNVLFRPMASLSRPRPSHDLGLEEGMELLIERLATPDLWLHPFVSTEYIKDLPCWRYDGWGNEDDLKSESETDLDSYSENETGSLLESHVCCQDEGCKMCMLWATVKETYVCHRCAILERKLEKKYLRYRNMGNSTYQNSTYDKLLKVCENCSRTKRSASSNMNQSRHHNNHDKSKRQWLISAQRLFELKWTAPVHAIESRVCAICLDRYRWSAVLCGLPCGHTYHHSCIMEWLSKDNHHCPTCRWPSYKAKVQSDIF